VQLHAAHGYLLSSFLSPQTNKRKDQWGGSLENRFRIIGEILKQARRVIGRFPVLIKISAYDFDQPGMRTEDSKKIAMMLEQFGCDGIEVSCGGVQVPGSSTRTAKIPPELNFDEQDWIYNYNVPAAIAIKSVVNIPVIAVGGLRRLDTIEHILGQEKVDFISMCRPFIIEPDIVSKFQASTQKESKCINCGKCLAGVFRRPLKCYHI
jgi:2,4-dienoyl-CoA reductase-like NADH-dependent reductase (Old Yellow Enzyme family)